MEMIKLGDLCNPSRGQIKERPDTIIDYIDISAIDNNSKTISGYQTMTFGEAPGRARKVVEKGNILVSTVRPNLNAVAILESDTPNMTVASTGFCVLECKESVDKRFVYNYCKSKAFIDELVSQATGASYPAVSDKIVREAPVPRYSYVEQKRIGETLDKAGLIIQKRKSELATLDDLIKARFVEMFGDPVSNPMRWGTVKLEDCLERIDNGKSFVCSDKPRTGIDPAVLKLSAATYGDYRPQENKALLDANQFIDAAEVHSGDLLFTRKNTPELVGMAAYVSITPPKLMMPDLIFRLVPNEKINPVFLWQLINCREFRPVIQAISGGSAKSMSNISKERLGKISVICPPRAEQDKLNPIIQQIDKSKYGYQKSFEETQPFEHLMQKILWDGKIMKEVI